MEEELKKFIYSSNKIKMTEREKSVLRFKVTSFAANLPTPEPSPYFSFGKLMHLKKALVMAAIAFTVGGGGLAFAANNALPGDILYPIKTNINEQIKGIFARTPEAKLAWMNARIEARAEEAKILASKNNLTEKRKKIIEKELAAYGEKIAKINRNKNIETKSITEGASKNSQIINKVKIKEAEKPKPNKERRKPGIKQGPKF